MQYCQLGRSGLRVSALTMGTATFGGVGALASIGNTDAATARFQIDMCLDAGVNLIDTADAYSDGLSEDFIGQAMAGRWGDTLIATKVRYPMTARPNDAGLSRWHLIRSCEASLQRLRTDHIDLYLLHGWDGLTPLEETLEALDGLVKSGKVRYIGCSNYSAWHLAKALGMAERHEYQRFIAQQIHYTLQAREAEHELVPIALDQGVGILVWSPLTGGLLSGKYRRGKEAPAGTRNDWTDPPINDVEKFYDIVEELVATGEDRGVSAAQVALAWLLGRPGVASLVIGGRTSQQFADNLKAAELKLSNEERTRLDRVSQVPLPYPYWHQAIYASDRLGPADLSLLGPHLRPV